MSVRVCILLVRMFFHSDERVFCVVRVFCVFCVSMRVCFLSMKMCFICLRVFFYFAESMACMSVR